MYRPFLVLYYTPISRRSCLIYCGTEGLLLGAAGCTLSVWHLSAKTPLAERCSCGCQGQRKPGDDENLSCPVSMPGCLLQMLKSQSWDRNPS